jgi:hypothetical protein
MALSGAATLPALILSVRAAALLLATVRAAAAIATAPMADTLDAAERCMALFSLAALTEPRVLVKRELS